MLEYISDHLEFMRGVSDNNFPTSGNNITFYSYWGTCFALYSKLKVTWIRDCELCLHLYTIFLVQIND
jgi:hypothetical protein